jgi:enolase
MNMFSPKIKNIYGCEVLDSRGLPTVEATVILTDGSVGTAISPSGASTGSKEAHELRDGNKKRYRSKGVLKAVSNIDNEIFEALEGQDASNQRGIDLILKNLDHTENKHEVGANATLAVSLAAAKAMANSLKMPLYRYIGGANAHVLPVPMMNIINGGKHASNSLAIQEFMIMPVSAVNFQEAVRMGSEIFHSLKDLLLEDGFETSVGDEGGFAPNFKTTQEALGYVSKAIESAGYKLDSDILIALDCAATEFYDDSESKYKIDGKFMNASDLLEFYKDLCAKFPIFSIEDPFAEHDIEGFKSINAQMGDKLQVVGDDLFCTNCNLLEQGIRQKLANAILIKPNQIGTLTETLDAIELAKRNSFNTIISHRSGETEDTTIAHLAVAVNAGQIKTGSLSRTDRVAKYNELIRIASELGSNGLYYGRKIKGLKSL